MARVYSALVSAALMAMALLSPSANPSAPTLALAVSVNSNPIRAPSTGPGGSRKTNTKRAQAKRQNVVVTLKGGTEDVIKRLGSTKFDKRENRLMAVRDELDKHSEQSQQGVHSALGSSDNHGGFTGTEKLWLTNQVLVQGATQETIEQLAKHPDVEKVSVDRIFPVIIPTLETTATETRSFATSAQWGINRVNAPLAWATGNTGEGVVVGVIDTGVRATHTALAGSFRSSYGWYDPETESATPYDVNGHGTHVVGTIAGSNGMGVAPGAKWFMCKGCRSTGCYQSDLLKCFQFMLCPTSPDGKEKDCSKAPHIVNNSWGGGQGLDMFQDVVAAWRAAGIIPVVAAGNTGSTCGTITTPGDYANVISVGATDVNDKLASYSSKGPTVRGLLKPDITAPGSLILSASYTSDTGVCFKSGTSMATPHVSGVIALLLSAKPGLSFDRVLELLQTRATTASLSRATGFTCGNTADGDFPNNQYGYGRIDAFRLLV